MSEPIHQEVLFEASPQRVYEALTDSAKHSQFTKGTSEISREVGGAFSCHDGQIEGRNIELVPGERIVQAWRVAAWEEGLYSVVRMQLRPEGEKTKLILDHAGVPAQMQAHIAGGWQQRYWGPLAEYL